MALTDKAVKAAKPNEKPYKMADGGGLHLSAGGFAEGAPPRCGV